MGAQELSPEHLCPVQHRLDSGFHQAGEILVPGKRSAAEAGKGEINGRTAVAEIAAASAFSVQYAEQPVFADDGTVITGAAGRVAIIRSPPLYALRVQ